MVGVIRKAEILPQIRQKNQLNLKALIAGNWDGPVSMATGITSGKLKRDLQ